MSVYPPITYIQERVKRADLGHTILVNQEYNIELPSSEPTEPTLSFTITSLPSIVGDLPYQPRYQAVIYVRFWLANGYTAYMRLKVNNVDKGLSSVYNGSAQWLCYQNISCVYVSLNDIIDIYAWASGSGVASIGFVTIVLIVLPKMSNKLAFIAGVRVSKLTFSDYISGANVTRPAYVSLSHDDVAETTLSDVGFAKLNYVARPSIYTNEVPPTFVASGSLLNYNLYILVPATVVWTE